MLKILISQKSSASTFAFVFDLCYYVFHKGCVVGLKVAGSRKGNGTM